jgi:thiazole synthase
VVVATGAWMNKLLPLPVQPCKGQMLALRPPPGQVPLSRVIFAESCYIIPKRDGRIVVGATVEPGTVLVVVMMVVVMGIAVSCGSSSSSLYDHDDHELT